MPIGYAVTVAIVAWGVACALTRWRRLGALSFYPSLLVNELPFLVAYWLLAATALAAAEGDLATVGGAVVAGFAALGLAGLAVIVRRALRTRATLDRALDEALPGPREVRRRPWARILRSPFFPGSRDVRRTRDIPYGTFPSQRLDVYRRRDHPTGGPVLLHLHGGGFSSGDKAREARPLIDHLVGRGWVAVSANYRLRPRVRPADQADDAASAIDWVRAHAAEYGGDPRTLFLAGGSAGAYLAAQAVFAGRPATGVICRYGYYGNLAPGGDIPPFLIIHGGNDILVPAADARAFAERVRAASPRPVVYAELPGGHHTFDLFPSIRSAAVVDAVDEFAARVIAAG